MEDEDLHGLSNDGNGWGYEEQIWFEDTAFPCMSPSFPSSTEIPDNGVFNMDCMDIMQDFSFMDLLEFPSENPPFQNLQTQMSPLVGPQQDSPDSEDLAMVFLDWLKSNKDSISADDFRNIELRRATIESTARRLGGGKKVLKQLLKLILQWVHQNQLPKIRHQQQQQISPNQSFQTSPFHNHYNFVTPYTSLSRSMSDSCSAYGNSNMLPFQRMATKEARKKRMARQRRVFNHNNRNHIQHRQNLEVAQQSSSHDDSNNNINNCNQTSLVRNWGYWSSPAVEMAEPPVLLTMVGNSESVGDGYPHNFISERPQVWKTEKKLRFLLQKVLKQSDVGGLGRIVLPKKEAEIHLPELSARDGITMSMEDTATSRVWNMRYRFWANNKSRMYLLENTGDFVKSNGLQEGDFIVIYSDIQCGKYMIRGVKVGQQGETRKSVKSQKNNNLLHSSSPPGNATSSSSRTL